MTANNETKVIPPPPVNKDLFERGPKERGQQWTSITDEERTLLDTVSLEDFQILNTVTARLWKTAPLADPVLALECIAAPYKGVIFAIEDFAVLPNADAPKGFVPVKFQVRVFKSPYGFEQDEQFDAYAREIFIAWLKYLQTHDYRGITSAKLTNTTIH